MLVADKEKVLDLEAVGVASVETGTPMRKDSLFWIASMTKSVTGTAMMLLVDEGKVKVADPVETYLPEFKGQQVLEEGKDARHVPQHPITVREVLSHTSGLILAGDKALNQRSLLSDHVAQYAAAPLIREPGTKYQYNNSGINTAGRIIEVVSGMPYFDFINTRLLEPLGMKDTTFWPSEEQAGRLAWTVKRKMDNSGLEDIHLDRNVPAAALEKLSQGVKVPSAMVENFGVGKVTDYARHYGEPAGGLFSTAADMGRFCQMLLNGGTWQGKRYLSKAAIEEMTRSQTGDVPVNSQEGYGLGWSVKIKDDEGPAPGSYGHRGARKTVMWVDPQQELVMVLLVQLWDIRPEDQKELYAGFMRAAVAKYGKAR